MNNLLKAEGYKLIHNKSFWGILFFSFLLGSVLLFDSRKLTEGLLNASLYNTPLLYFLIIIFAVLFIGEDFGNRTIHLFMSGGHERGSVLFSKAFLYSAACEIILAGPLLLHGLIGVVTGNTVGLSAVEFLVKMVLVFLAVLAMGMLPFTFAFIFKDIGRTLAVPLTAFFLMVFVLNGDSSGRAAVILPIGQLRLLSLNKLAVPETVIWGIDVFWIVVLYTVSYISLCRSDLK